MYKLLHQFKVIADTKNLTKAGEILSLSQPTLTQNIARLEQQLGASLIIRKKHGIELTEYGEDVYINAKKVVQAYNLTINSIENLKSKKKKLIKIGCGYTWTHSEYLKILKSIISEHDELKFQITNGESLSLQQKLISNDYDIIIGAIPYKLVQDKEIIYTPLTTVKFGIFACKDHPLANSSNISDSQLEVFNWVRLHHDDELLSREDPYDFPVDYNRVKLEVRSVTTALELVRGSDYLLSLPLNLEKIAELHGLKALSITSSPPYFETGLMYSQKNTQAEIIANEFIDSFMNSAK